MWTSENRARYNRDPLRYPSDTTEEEWTEIAPLLPPARRGGQFPQSSRRAVPSFIPLAAGRRRARDAGGMRQCL